MFIRLVFLILCLVSLTPFAFSGERSYFYGHNLTSTSDTLKEGQWTIGTLALFYGVNDDFTVGTSPWLAISYNMPAIHARYRWTHSPDLRSAVEINYFKTYPYFADRFSMEGTMEKYIVSVDINSTYTIHSMLMHQYFFTEKKPHSLRQSPHNDDPYALAAGVLHEAHLTERFGLFFELGILGINYTYPYRHYGFSFFWRGDGWYATFGYSISESRFRKTDSGRGSVTDIDQAEHPEIQVQFMF